MRKKLPFEADSKTCEVAVSGKAFRYIVDNRDTNPFVFNSIIEKGRIFARMGPEMKAELVLYTK